MYPLFETIKVAGNTLFNPDYHNARVNQARHSLYHTNDTWDLNSLIQLPELNPDVVYKCRFLYNRDAHAVEFLPYTRREVRTLKLVDCPGLDYHLKYLDRTALEKVRQENTQFDDVIFVQNNRITDCSFANIVFFDGNRGVTPSSPLLKGTKRQKYIDDGVVFEDDILVTDLPRFTRARLINAMIDLSESTDVEIVK